MIVKLPDLGIIGDSEMLSGVLYPTVQMRLYSCT